MIPDEAVEGMSERLEVIRGTFGHGSIKLTAFLSSGRVSVETVGINPVMDWTELLEFVDEMRATR